jgi:hypothetical protein
MISIPEVTHAVFLQCRQKMLKTKGRGLQKRAKRRKERPKERPKELACAPFGDFMTAEDGTGGFDGPQTTP